MSWFRHAQTKNEKEEAAALKSIGIELEKLAAYWLSNHFVFTVLKRIQREPKDKRPSPEEDPQLEF